jgi:PAS domain S-box-containing protein
VLTPDLMMVEATDAFLKKTLVRREDIVGQPLFLIFPNNPETPQINSANLVHASLQQALEQKEPHHIDQMRYDLPAEEGFEERYWSASSVPVLGDNDQVLYLVQEVRDITEQVMMERLHQQSQEHLNLLTSATKAIAWEYDIVNNRMTWGDGLKEIFGYTPEEMGFGGESWDSRVHPDDFAYVQQSIRQALEQKQETWIGEYRFRKANGSYAYILDQGYTVYDSDSRPVRTIGSIIDITQSKDAEQALRESDARFRHLIDILPHMAWTASPQGKVLYFNENWYSYTGMRQGQTDGWINVIHPEDSAIALTAWHQAVASGEPFEVEYRIRHHLDGTYRWFLERGQPMRDADGKVTIWMGTFTDIDDHKLDAETEEENKLEHLLRISPVHLCVLQGPQHVCQYITPGVYKMYGNRNYLGRTARELWPELKPLGFFEMLHEVYTKGRTVHINEFHTSIDHNLDGNTRDAYINFKYQPMFDSTNQIEGIMISAIEVTHLVKARQRAEQLAGR